VVLLDIGLPSINGYEVARRIRGLANQQAVHLIAVTGYGQTADKALAQAAGFSAYLVKPIEFTALEHALACLPFGNQP
jgi:CheY-like chemotaxis protein